MVLNASRESINRYKNSNSQINEELVAGRPGEGVVDWTGDDTRGVGEVGRKQLCHIVSKIKSNNNSKSLLLVRFT